MRPARILLTALAVLMSAATAVDAQPTTMRVRGQVTHVDASAIVVSTREGGPLRVGLADNYSVYELAMAPQTALTVGRYVGIVGEHDGDGRIRALAVLVFPERLRGSAEGQRPWDLTPRSTMTSATISGVSPASAGLDLAVTFRGGQAIVRVAPGVPIVELIAAPRDLLGSGVNVYITAAQMPDGSVTAARVLVGRGGLVPPI